MFKLKEKEKFSVVKAIAGVCFIIACGTMVVPMNEVRADVFIYPEKGQSQEQMEKDKFECYNWAKGQTGFDPMEVPTATAPPPEQQAQQGGVGRGAVRGAAVGVTAGAIAGDAGKGAAIGAASGALVGGMRRRDQQRSQQQAEQQWAQEQSAQYQQRRSSYDRAYGACLEGRGYSVK
jgi:hypothetical protein